MKTNYTSETPCFYTQGGESHTQQTTRIKKRLLHTQQGESHRKIASGVKSDENKLNILATLHTTHKEEKATRNRFKGLKPVLKKIDRRNIAVGCWEVTVEALQVRLLRWNLLDPLQLQRHTCNMKSILQTTVAPWSWPSFCRRTSEHRSVFSNEECWSHHFWLHTSRFQKYPSE